MTYFVAPSNDFRSLRRTQDVRVPTVTVIIPVYNRSQLLANALASLTLQRLDGPFNVLVVDDGSEEDISAVVDVYSEQLDVTLLHQARDGFGLARARNLGVASTSADVVVFLDADCIPGEDWLEGHVSWHRKASNLVVTGPRKHIEELCSAEAISDRAVDLAAMARDHDNDDPSGTDDWRRIVYRRSQDLLLSDAAFRAAIGGNTSVSRAMLLAVGGVSEDFRAWGGEDTELAWRLWNGGAFVIPESRALIYHQSYGDAPDVDQSRAEARGLALPLIADRVPHRFYRRTPSHLYTVPKVSWIVSVASRDEADRAWETVSLATFTDTELVVFGDKVATGNRRSLGDASRDLGVAESFGEAVTMARGEFLAIVDGRIPIDRRLLARAMKRFSDRRVSAVRVAYDAGGTRLIRLKDLAAIDAAYGGDALPFFGLIRRRELMKDPDSLRRAGDAWKAALKRSRTALHLTDAVEVPATVQRRGWRHLPTVGDIAAAGPTDMARIAKQTMRSRRSADRDAQVETHPATSLPDTDDVDSRVAIEYVGFTGQQNLGDDAVLEAIRQLMPWANIDVGVPDARVLMLGGGTLFNSTGMYLRKLRHLDGPTMERVVFGTGARNPDFWGITENVVDWNPFLESALLVGVRGPDSVASMRGWGYEGPIEVIGDPALSLTRPDGIERVDGRIVVCPLHTGGELWGGDDAVFDTLAASVARLKAEGRDVVMMTAHPADDRWALEIMRRSGHPDLEYVAGYDNLDDTLALLASADLVVGERLHAVVLAAAMGTPFVALEYRPKILDFARSIDAERWVIRTDRMDQLDPMIDAALVQRHKITGYIESQVQALVAKQHEHATAIGAELGGGRYGANAR